MKGGFFHLLILLGLMACTSARPLPGSRGAACDYVVLTGAGEADVVRGFDPKAALATLSPAKAELLLALLPGFLKAYLAEHPGEPKGEVAEMRWKVLAGEYHVQMIPYTVGGRCLVLLNLLDKKHGGTYWRRAYYSINDGGAENGLCVIDLHTGKILMAHCNGYG